jgi:hypothetical protein
VETFGKRSRLGEKLGKIAFQFACPTERAFNNSQIFTVVHEIRHYAIWHQIR